MNEKNCETHLLNDEPANTDSFNGAYQRVADAMAQLIFTGTGGVTIGLRGVWGAGKSTIINLLSLSLKRQEPSEGEEVAVWIFDAWAHRGGLLRRAFLEQLIAYLGPEGEDWISKRDWRRRWRDQPETLGRKPARSTSKVSTKPGLGTFLLALSAAMLPSGAALLSAGVARDKPIPLLWGLGTLLLLGSLAVVLVSWLLNRKNKSRLSLYTDVTDKTTVVNESPEPSTLEFRRAFEGLMEATIERHQRRLVIVIDNLDRVSETDAQNLVGTLQIFFDFRENQPASIAWWGRVWFIVTYNPLVRSAATLADGSDEQRSLSSGSLEESLKKRIQVTFNVPPPVMSEWRSYLSNAISEALPAHAAKAMEHTNLYRMLRAVKPDPTPREIKSFVNNVGALHRQWGDVYGLEPLAYYECLRIWYPDPRALSQALASGNEPRFGFANILGGKEGRRSLASLHFNVDTDLAEQLLLRRPLEDILKQGQVTAFNELLSHVFGTTEILDEMDFGGWDAMALANVGRVLVESQLNALRYAPFLPNIARKYGSAIEECAWGEAEAPDAKTTLKCCVALDQGNAFRKLLNSLAAGANSELSAKRWLSVVCDGVALAKDAGKIQFYEHCIELPPAGEPLILACRFLIEKRGQQVEVAEDVIRNLAAGAGTDEKAGSVAQNIEAGSSMPGYSSTVAILVEVASEAVQTRLLKAVQSRFTAQATTVPAESAALIRCLYCFWGRENLNCRDVVVGLVESGRVAECVGLLSPHSMFSTETAYGLWLWQQVEPAPVNRSGSPQRQAGWNWAMAVLQQQSSVSPQLADAYAQAVAGKQAGKALVEHWEKQPPMQEFFCRNRQNVR